MLLAVTPPSELKACDERLSGKFVVGWLSRLLPEGKELVANAAAKNINLIDTVSVPRITIAQKLDVLSSQVGEIIIYGSVISDTVGSVTIKFAKHKEKSNYKHRLPKKLDTKFQ
jgi:NAD/NADP transhydrogenase alpha subunit